MATVAGGATVDDVIAAALPYGLTLGGDYGPVTPLFGLALENLLAADVVLQDGSLVTADRDNNPDLFSALRGGDGNPGVVTSMRIQLRQLSNALAPASV